MATAPTDGTMVRLLVEFEEHSTEDAEQATTIGANNLDNDEEDVWRFAGWCWSHDHFTEGKGMPIGWLPMLDGPKLIPVAEQPAPVVPELTPELRWILGQMCFQHIHTAQALRLMGHQIARKAEDEQAVTIYWMLGHYLKDPANWRQNATDEMKAAAPPAQEYIRTPPAKPVTPPPSKSAAIAARTGIVMPKRQPELARIYNVFGLSSNHELSTLLINIENAKRFSDLLHAVEREFFMVPGEPSGEPEDKGAPIDDECLVNSWGSTQQEYLRQLRAALPIATANSVPTYEPPVTGEKWSLDGENGSWDYDSLDDLLKDNYGHDSDGDGHPASFRLGLYEGGTVYHGIECKDDPADFVPDLDHVIEHMAERAYESDAGEWADNYPDLDALAKAELDIALAPLKAWARKHCQPNFFTIKEATPYIVTAEDVSRSRKP